jgi:hypothetical protein
VSPGEYLLGAWLVYVSLFFVGVVASTIFR